MSIHDLLPGVSRLSRAEKFRRVQRMLQQLAEEEEVKAPTSGRHFDPSHFHGRGQSSREAMEAYLAASRAGWEP